MALTKCTDCGKECSTEAMSCPNCGKPIKKVADPSYVNKDLGFGGCIYSFMLIGGVGLAIYGSVNEYMRGVTIPGVLIALSGIALLLARLRIWSGIGHK